MFSWFKFDQLCKERGVKPHQVSVATGIPTSALTAWKNKYTRADGSGYCLKADKIKKIADYFGVPLDFFVEEEAKDSGYVVRDGKENSVITKVVNLRLSPNIHISVDPRLKWLEHMETAWSYKARDCAEKKHYDEALSAKNIADAYSDIADCVRDAVSSGAPEWWFESRTSR